MGYLFVYDILSSYSTVEAGVERYFSLWMDDSKTRWVLRDEVTLGWNAWRSFDLRSCWAFFLGASAPAGAGRAASPISFPLLLFFFFLLLQLTCCCFGSRWLAWLSLLLSLWLVVLLPIWPVVVVVLVVVGCVGWCVWSGGSGVPGYPVSGSAG